MTDLVESVDSSLVQTGARVGDEVIDEAVEHLLQGLVEFQLFGRVGVNLLDFAVEAFEDRNAVADLIEREQVSFESVIEVGGVVGDFVGQVDELGFQRRALVEQIFGEIRMIVSRS